MTKGKATVDLALPWNCRDMHIKDSQGRIVASVHSSIGTFTDEELNAREQAITAAVNERDQLLAEVARLREAFRPLAVRVEKMMMDGPECDCPAEGHMCGWPDLQREMEAARAALSSGKE